MKRRLFCLSAGSLLLAHSAIADPIIVVRPNIGSGTAGVLPQTAFSASPETPAEEPSQAPLTLQVPSQPRAIVGLRYYYQLRAIGAVGAVRFSATSLPPGLTLNVDTGGISGYPTSVGQYPFTVEATDSTGRTASNSITFVVEPTPIQLSYQNPQYFTVGQPGEYSPQVGNSEGQISFAIINSQLPKGLTLNSATGKIQGTAERAGTYWAIVQVTDSTKRVSMIEISFKID